MVRVLFLLLLMLPGLARADYFTNSGPSAGSLAPGTNLSTGNVTATASATARTLAARAAQQLNVKDGCGAAGAVGDGVADDSAAIAACENLAVTDAAAGSPVAVYFPGGNYLVKSTQLPILTNGVALIGDGVYKTYITIDPSYAGTLFGWSEAWFASTFAGPSQAVSGIKIGAYVDGLTVIGNTTAASEQDAFVFWGRNDAVTFRDVAVYLINGQCLVMGYTTGGQTQAYMRESFFENFVCSDAGTATKPAVEISSTTTNGSDATNELHFVKLDIFGAVSTGLQIHNPTAFSATRLIDFVEPRIEQSGGDNIQIGAAGDLGQTDSIRMYGLQSLTPGGANSGFFGLNLGLGTVQDYDFQALGGQIGPCLTGTCNGVNVNNIRLSKISLENITTTGTNVTVTANVGTSVVLDGNGQEQYWTWSISSGANPFIMTPLYKFGNPSSTLQSGTTGAPFVSVVIPDATSTFGNAPAQGAINLQLTRSSANQVPGAAGSALLAGANNAITGGGSNGAIVAGTGNLVNGVEGFIGGGLNATDRGRASSQAFAAGDFAATGDAQQALMVISCATTTSAACRLTVANFGANSTGCINIPNATTYQMLINIVALDHTTVANNEEWSSWGGLMTRGASAATTAVSMSSTPTPVTNGTVTGSSIAASADTTNGCLNLSFTPPTSNTDTWRVVARVETVEVQ